MNRIKRCLVLVILSTMLVSVFQSVHTEAATSIPKNEYERGVWYGFMPSAPAEKNAAKKTITYKQFCTMLGNMIKKTNKQKYSSWKKLTKKAPKTKMKRDAGAIALTFAAKTLGYDYLNANNGQIDAWLQYDWKSHYSRKYKVFPWKKKVTSHNDPGLESFGVSYKDYADWSFMIVCRRVSVITGKPLYTCTDKSDFRMDKALTIKDAMIAAVRLYESEEGPAFQTAEKILSQVIKTSKAKSIVDKADARRQSILTSETKIVKSDSYKIGETYTGTAYYVSNSGDDSNDGKSPDTAWKTLARLAKQKFSFGDAIFFKRGDTWRNAQIPGNIRATEGLTLSAYGTGEKPKMYGSTENGTGEAKWSLYYESGNKKIWKYHRPLSDVSVIVLNDGKSFCKRYVAYWNGSKYVDIHNQKKGFSVKTDLPDMECFPDLKYPDNPEYKDRIYQIGWDDESQTTVMLTGDLYLRCDKGNPGALYSSIEFTEPYSLADGVSNHTVFDNIDCSYGLSPVAGGMDMPEYVYFQNCVSGWGGGEICYYSDKYYDVGDHTFAPSHGYLFMDGGSGFNAHGRHAHLTNNYIHHGFQDGFGTEIFTFKDQEVGDILISGNLVEYCVFAGGYLNWDTESKYPAKNVTITDNYVLYTGFENFYNVSSPIEVSYTKQEFDYTTAPGWLGRDSNAFAVGGAGKNKHDGTLKVTNNVFAFSFGQLVFVANYTKEYSRVYEGNTYAQLPGFAWFATQHGDLAANLDKITDPEKAVRTWIYDKTGTIIQ